MTLSTPSGTPASCAIFTSIIHAPGSCSLGFTMNVLPHTSAIGNICERGGGRGHRTPSAHSPTQRGITVHPPPTHPPREGSRYTLRPLTHPERDHGTPSAHSPTQRGITVHSPTHPERDHGTPSAHSPTHSPTQRGITVHLPTHPPTQRGITGHPPPTHPPTHPPREGSRYTHSPTHSPREGSRYTLCPLTTQRGITVHPPPTHHPERDHSPREGSLTQRGIMAGKLNGVTPAQTPRGSR